MQIRPTSVAFSLLLAALFYFFFFFESAPVEDRPQLVLTKTTETQAEYTPPAPDALPTPAITKPAPPKPTAPDASNAFLEALKKSLKNASLEDIYREPQHHFIAVAVDDDWVIQGDILVDEKHLLPQTSKGEVRIAKVEGISYWHEGMVPYTIDAAVENPNIQAAMQEIMKKTAVRFIPWNNEKDFVAILPTDKDCMSNLGRQGGEQKIVVNPRCSTGTIMHELMHTLGFVHEHSRADRDEHITIWWEQIQDPFKHQFQKFSAAISLPEKSTFDFDSILLYPSEAFAKKPNSPTMVKKDGSAFPGKRDKLSSQDIQKISALYPRKSK